MLDVSKSAWLAPFIRPLRPVFIEVFAMSFFVNIIALAIPIFSLQVYDRVIGNQGFSTLQGLAIGMLLVLAFDFILRQARSRILQTVAMRIDVLVGREIFRKFISLPLQTLESRTANQWQSLFRDVDMVRNTLSGASAVLVCDIPFAILFLGLILTIATPVAWVLLIILPAFLFVAWRSANVMTAANRQERDSAMTRDSLIAEMIAGRATIKALALDRAMGPMWEERHAKNIESAIQRGAKTDFYQNVGASLTMITTIAMTSVGAIAIITQNMTMGALIAANMLSGRLLGPLNQLVGQWRSFTGFRQSVERLGEAFSLNSERLEAEIRLGKPNGEIVAENVVFSYAPNLAPVVDSVSVTIKAGGIHILVGRNGSGKSTLLKLLMGLYSPQTGRVLLDGADIAQFTRGELATWIGYVPQDCVLFAGSVRDNIAYRVPGATDEQIIKAATAAGVHHFIIDLPDGYASDIGEAGRRLSGGQRQRIAIARALVGDPVILVLDEPSSSLDRQAETELRATLTDLAKTHTVLMVTHSPVLLTCADDLVALDRGKVALAGPAKEILPRLFGQAPPPKESPGPAAPAATPKPAPAATPKPSQAASPSPVPVAPKPVVAPSQTAALKPVPMTAKPLTAPSAAPPAPPAPKAPSPAAPAVTLKPAPVAVTPKPVPPRPAAPPGPPKSPPAPTAARPQPARPGPAPVKAAAPKAAATGNDPYAQLVAELTQSNFAAGPAKTTPKAQPTLSAVDKAISAGRKGDGPFALQPASDIFTDDVERKSHPPAAPTSGKPR